MILDNALHTHHYKESGSHWSHRQSRPKHYKLFVLSVLVHVLFVILIIYISPSRDEVLLEVAAPIPVISYLYSTPPPKQTLSVAAKPITELAVEQITSKPPDKVESKISEKTDNITAKEKLVRDTESKAAPKTETEQTSTPTVAKQTNNALVIDKGTRTQSNAIINTDQALQQLVSKHLQNYNNDYSLEQATAYRKLQTSPIIDSQSAVDTVNRTITRPSITVDCNSTINQVFAGISFLGGGTVNCRNNAEFQHFIDERLPPPSEQNKPKDK